MFVSSDMKDKHARTTSLNGVKYSANAKARQRRSVDNPYSLFRIS